MLIIRPERRGLKGLVKVPRRSSSSPHRPYPSNSKIIEQGNTILPKTIRNEFRSKLIILFGIILHIDWASFSRRCLFSFLGNWFPRIHPWIRQREENDSWTRHFTQKGFFELDTFVIEPDCDRTSPTDSRENENFPYSIEFGYTIFWTLGRGNKKNFVHSAPLLSAIIFRLPFFLLSEKSDFFLFFFVWYKNLGMWWRESDGDCHAAYYIQQPGDYKVEFFVHVLRLL